MTVSSHVRLPLTAAKLALLGLSLTCCLDNKLADEAPGGAGIVQTRDFKDFRNWMTFEPDQTTDHSGLLGETTIYLNKLPDDNANAFAVGTILVKTMKPADGGRFTIHAMAKRGAGYNPDGAKGWEYFELALNKNDVPIILWGGAAPPSGEEYQRLLSKAGEMASGVDGDCNSCHAEGHDGVLGSVSDLLK